MPTLTPEDAAKPYRLRIPPASPRERYKSTSLGKRFEKKERWYPCTDEERAKLSKVLLFDTNPASPPLFQIVTPEEARRIDIDENVAGASNEAAAAQREAKLQAELDKAHAKIDEQAGALASLTAGQSRLEQLLAQLIANQQPQPSGLPVVNVAFEPVIVKPEEKPEPKVDAKAEQKPARPGEKREGKAKPAAKPEAKADDEQSDAKSVSGAADATAAYDDSLKAEGFTPNR